MAAEKNEANTCYSGYISMKEKLPKIINRTDKETLGWTPEATPQEGLKILRRAVNSGAFTITNDTPDRKHGTRRKNSIRER